MKHAQICSQILKKLLSVKAFHQPPDKLFANIELLESKLQEWRASLPRDYLATDMNPFTHLYKERSNMIRLHSAYYGSIIAIHAVIHYPWICSLLLNHREEFYWGRVAQSSAQAAMASRQMLLSLKNLAPDFAFPQP